MNSTLENKSDYYTKKTTLELLKVSENILKKLVVEFEIPTITGYYSKGGTNRYLKKTVDDIIALQKKEVDMYISAAHATEKYGGYITWQANTMIGPKGLERVVNSLRVIAPELPFNIHFIELTEADRKSVV